MKRKLNVGEPPRHIVDVNIMAYLSQMVHKYTMFISYTHSTTHQIYMRCPFKYLLNAGNEMWSVLLFDLYLLNIFIQWTALCYRAKLIIKCIQQNNIILIHTSSISLYTMYYVLENSKKYCIFNCYKLLCI